MTARLFSRSLPALAVALAVAACSDATTKPAAAPTTTDGAPTLEASVAAAERNAFSNPITQLIDGIGTIAMPCKGCSGTASGTQSYVFAITQRKDGTLAGGIYYSYHTTDGFSADQGAQPYCMNDLGDGVWLLGFKTSYHTGPSIAATGPLPIDASDNYTADDYMLLAVKDNDIGFRRSGPDQITGVLHTTNSEASSVTLSPGPPPFVISNVASTICNSSAIQTALGFTAAGLEAKDLNNFVSGFIEVLPNP
jgi:hypothetical protein